ncbi:venom carboxylesterase-6 [Orussus abietinus]|uniref:venom carboxylesterase-6 n=1 Tax=Orussus abietinus TaxID=222816 RepID=UPI00062549E1|nr:venom carboxylesterase-6 [Orussus abietinus]
MKLPVILLALILGELVCSEEEDAPRVRTPLGRIKGYHKVSQHGRLYRAFEGIPYALPPVGKLRFKPPQRIPAWPGELLATKFGSMCLQYSHFPDSENRRVFGAEDCLYLNVYAPVKDDYEQLLPVIIWIHGGAFQYGCDHYTGAKYLLDRDVILVTINYRLGPFGFLSTEDEVIPGNNGLKDQSMALRWVSENIEWFGGDPKRVTLTGLSAGGVSVHYHYLSPLSAGLFQGGISFSGTSFTCWAQTENSAEKAKKLGALMGCPTSTTKEMVRCLRYRPAQSIVEAEKEFMPWLYNPFTPFGPVVEKVGDAPFIDRSPVEIVSSGSVQDVPWVTGVVSEEGLYPVAEFAADRRLLKELEDNWETIAPHLLDFNYTVPRSKHVETARAIKKHYFGSKPIDRLTVKQLIQMVGDRLFVTSAEEAARKQAEANQSPVWFYYYTYRGAHSLSEAMSHTKENFGVSHADDAYYVLDNPFVDPTTTPEDRDIQESLIDFWVSFATKKVPTLGVEWPELDPSQTILQYLHIAGPGKFKMESNQNLGEKSFWSSIDFNENKLEKSKSAKDEL